VPSANVVNVMRASRPIAEFRFHYRSRGKSPRHIQKQPSLLTEPSKAGLKQELIIPRTPSPSPDTILGTLTEDQIRALARAKLEEQKVCKAVIWLLNGILNLL